MLVLNVGAATQARISVAAPSTDTGSQAQLQPDCQKGSLLSINIEQDEGVDKEEKEAEKGVGVIWQQKYDFRLPLNGLAYEADKK